MDWTSHNFSLPLCNLEEYILAFRRWVDLYVSASSPASLSAGLSVANVTFLLLHYVKMCGNLKEDRTVRHINLHSDDILKRRSGRDFYKSTVHGSVCCLPYSENT